VIIIITRHQVLNMPQESKGQGISTSEIILGFQSRTRSS
jgi:hypothetical protein